jgi:hypothetical protein
MHEKPPHLAHYYPRHTPVCTRKTTLGSPSNHEAVGSGTAGGAIYRGKTPHNPYTYGYASRVSRVFCFPVQFTCSSLLFRFFPLIRFRQISRRLTRARTGVAILIGLRRLILEDCYEVRDQDILHICKLKNLTHLDLGGCQIVADLQKNGESVQEPLATKKYSGRFMVRVPPELHRQLALEAAESGISLNRLASDKLSRTPC